jgi:hypothetical protein
MRDIKPETESAHPLLRTEFINRPVDLGPMVRRAAVERYWLERMAEPDSEEQK